MRESRRGAVLHFPECRLRRQTIRAVLFRGADFLLPVGEDAAALERAHSSLQPVLAQLGLVARGVDLGLLGRRRDDRSVLHTRFLQGSQVVQDRHSEERDDWGDRLLVYDSKVWKHNTTSPFLQQN